MSRGAVGFATLAVLAAAAVGQDAPPPAPAPAAESTELRDTFARRYGPAVERILAAARTESRVYDRLRHLCDVIGPRLSGSPGHDAAVKWCVATMQADGLDDARAEPVRLVPWIRGAESAVMTAPRRLDLHMLGLGNSVGTPPEGVEAEVVVVKNLEELQARSDEVKGRIVLFDHAMPQYDPETGTGYGSTVVYRVIGPSRAAAAGAVGVLVRSVTATSLQTPHTGMLRYDEELPQIPAAALTIEDTELIRRLSEAGETVKVRLTMGARFGEETTSHNVVAELRGREKPEEVIVVGGHLDSWDVGQGAHDDGGGSMMAWEAVRLLKALDLRPRRTIRVVLYTNEENGLRGAEQYVADHLEEMPRHVAAIESDSGSFKPLGFSHPKPGDPAQERARQRLEAIAALLGPLGADEVVNGGGGADIGKMAPHGVPQIGLRVDMATYFDVHHTHADTFDKVDREHLEAGAACLAVMTYVLAEMPERLLD